MGIFQNIKKMVYIAVDKIRKGFIKARDAISRFFRKALDMMKTGISKLASKVRGVILGASHFIRKVGNAFVEGTKNYSLDREVGQWYETTVTRKISPEEVPEKYRRMEGEFEEDDTEELEAAMEY